jgi:hypothetical protein
MHLGSLDSNQPGAREAVAGKARALVGGYNRDRFRHRGKELDIEVSACSALRTLLSTLEDSRRKGFGVFR